MADDGSTATAETTQQEKPDDQKFQLDGNGNWYEGKNYTGYQELSPEMQGKFDGMLKEAQGNVTRKYQDISSNKQKFSYGSAEEALKDPQFRTELQNVSTQEDQTNQAVESGAGFMRDVVKMVSEGRISGTQYQNYLNSLNAPEQVTFETAVRQELQTKKTNEENISRTDGENLKKYGERYNELKPRFSDIYNSAGNNPQELAFKALNYEENYKRGYEKGLQEQNTQRSGLNTTSGIGESTNTRTEATKPINAADAMVSTLRDAGWTDAQMEQHFGRG